LQTGIYFDMRNPPAWPTSPARLYGFTLEMCEEAERMGCHSIWLSEHHMFDDGYLPQPLTMAAAVAARTRTPRIGTAIVIAPLHHPVELAEQAAIVDIISDGRLDLGIGAGYRIPEFDLLGADLSRRYSTTDDRARQLRRLWDDVVTPTPVQGRLPIWMGYQGPQGAGRAGRLGEGLLSPDANLWPAYREGLVEGGHDPASGRMTGSFQSWMSDDPERDWPVVSRHLSSQLDSYRRYMVEGTGRPAPRPVDTDKLRQRGIEAGPLQYFLYGTVEEVASQVRAATAGAPVETLYFWASIAGMPEELVAAQIDLICTKLAPLLADYDPSSPVG
jgi:alkanesulfonate monooxygenase SsuD/methylene tetrahydromethanopterin reductase-like flavin-dependent oxidoreductase (luciferase family)